MPIVRMDGKNKTSVILHFLQIWESRGERCKGLVSVMLACVLDLLTTGNKISPLETKKRKKHN